MAALPEFVCPTLASVDSALVDGQDMRRRAYLGMSAIGSACSRALWYQFRWAWSVRFDATTLKRFEDGHRSEDLAVARLKQLPGLTVHETDEAGGQWSFKDFGGHFSGHMDGVCLGLVQAPQTWHVLEIKASEKWQDLDKVRRKVGEKSALAEWNPVYYAQAVLYMDYAGIDRHWLVCVSPGGRRWTAVRTNADPAFAGVLKAKAESIIFTDHAPSRIGGPDSFACRFCDFAPLCHEGARAERNCRTCMDAGVARDGYWFCVRYGHELSRTDQEAGCADHRYLPDLVAGEQVDVEHGRIIYRMHAPIMSNADFAMFVANEKAKVRHVMVPATLRDHVAADDDHHAEGHGEDHEQSSSIIGMPGWQRDLGDGALAQFVAHTCASAPSPQPWLTLGAGLAMFGAAAGRRYAGPTNLRTNLYAIGIADSGGGKDHPLRASTRLMIAAGLANHVGSSKIASGAGLLTAITRNPSIYFPLDEVGFLISSAADRKRAPKHLTEIIDNLTEFYSLADSTFLGIAYANDKEKPREVIEQPCLCLFGVTTPGVFWGSLSSDNVIDGSLARMLIFESENHYPDPQHDLISNDPPADLVALMEAVAKGADGSTPFPLGNAASAIPKPWTVPYSTPQAEARARAMREEQIDMLRRHQGTHLTGIIARLAENAAKVALIKAITDNPGSPQITAADLDWGMGIASRSVQTLMQAVKERVADNEYEALVKRVHKVIADAGSAGIDGKELSRKSQFLDRRKRADVVAHLEEAGMIRGQVFPQPAGERGRPRTIYFDIA